MRDRKEIESDMEQFISAHPMVDEIAFYHKLILEIFLDIRGLLEKKESSMGYSRSIQYLKHIHKNKKDKKEAS